MSITIKPSFGPNLPPASGPMFQGNSIGISGIKADVFSRTVRFGSDEEWDSLPKEVQEDIEFDEAVGKEAFRAQLREEHEQKKKNQSLGEQLRGIFTGHQDNQTDG